jgi:hypothetical protein
MTTPLPAVHEDKDDEISVFAIGTVLVRWRWVILGGAVLGLLIGLALAIREKHKFKSDASFIPQGSSGGSSGLAYAASQLGFSVGSSGGGWSPTMYVELVKQRAVLEPIALDTFTVAELGNKKGTLLDILNIRNPNREQAILGGVGQLQKWVTANEDRKLGAVVVSASTPWASLSLQLAERVIQAVNRFNIETRQSQASDELRFVQTQLVTSEAALRQAEQQFQQFLLANRSIEGSPGLQFERDRLRSEVNRLNQLYTSWLQSREEARIRQIRDTPVITILAEPHLAQQEEPRKNLPWSAMGFVAGFMIASILAFVVEGIRKAGESTSPQAREFFRVLADATPSFLRRRPA